MKTLFLLATVSTIVLIGLAAAGDAKRLGPAALARAEAFLRRDARPLDLYRWEHDLRKGDSVRLLAELAKFQNEDGGFGRGLEPDLRCRESSAPATVEGLAIVQEAGAGPDHPMVQAAVRYFVSSFDERQGYWSAVPPEVTGAPHAPWWHPDAQTGKAPAETPAYPTAAILASLHHYHALVPPDLLQRATAALLRHLAEAPDKLEVGEVTACLRLAGQLPEPRRGEMLAKLTRVAAATVARGRSDWAHYGLQPLMVAGSPDAPLYSGLRAEVDANLDYVIESQDADGGWSPNWSWEKVDAAAWAQARREWRGMLALENLRRLRAFERL